MITELLMGVPQAVIGFRQMRQLSKVSMPEYSVSPELQSSYNRAEKMAMQGYTPAERASMFQSQAGSTAAQTRAGLARTGGSMASALQVIGGMNQNQFLLGFGSQDAQLRRQNIKYADTLMRDVDKVKMMNQELRIRRDQEKRQAASNLFNMGLQNISSGLSDAEGMVGEIAGMALTGGLSGLAGGLTKSNTGAQSFLGNKPSGTLDYKPMSHEQAMQSFYFK